MGHLLFNLYRLRTAKSFVVSSNLPVSLIFSVHHYWFTFIFILLWRNYFCHSLFLEVRYFSAFLSTIIFFLPLCSSVKHKYRLTRRLLSFSFSLSVSLPFSFPIWFNLAQSRTKLSSLLEPLCSGIIYNCQQFVQIIAQNISPTPKPVQDGWDKQREASCLPLGV